MVREYELMYIVRPDVDEDGLRAAMESVQTLIEGLGGEVTKTTPWGKRRLAYEVSRLRDGHYVILELSLDGGRVAALERALQIHDTVFRHLVVLREVHEEAPENGQSGGRERWRERDRERMQRLREQTAERLATERRGRDDDEDEVDEDGGDLHAEEAPPAAAAEAAPEADGDEAVAATAESADTEES